MDDLKECAKALGSWAYEILSIKIPLLNVSFWVFFLTLFAIGIMMKTTDVITHGSRGYNNDNNNNKIYKDK